ncbi:MAG: helix-turn-helix domain-containing protein [bacterium]|nr:helix-turn-helix domain-containing protein [bacterium]
MPPSTKSDDRLQWRERPVLRVNEIAEILGVHRSTVHRLVDRGLLERVKRDSCGVAWVSTDSLCRFLGEDVSEPVAGPPPGGSAPRAARAKADLLIASLRSRDT